MDEKYLSELWNWTNSQDPTFKDRYTFDSWSKKLKSNEGYKKQFYGWVSGIDETFEERRPYNAWSEMVSTDKKKEESALFSREGGTLSATPGTGEVGLSGFTRSSRYDEVLPGAVEPPVQREAAPVVQTISPKQREEARAEFKPSLSLYSGVENMYGNIVGLIPTIYDFSAEMQNDMADVFGADWLRTSYSEDVPGLRYIKNLQGKFYEHANYYKEKQRQYDEDITTSISKGNYTDALQQVVSGGLESLPDIALSALSGAGALKAGLAVLGTTQAVNRYEEIKDNENMSGTAKVIDSSLTGMAEAIFESVFGTAQSAKIFKEIIEKEGKEKASAIIKKGINEFYETAAKKYPLLITPIGEGFSELGTQVTQNLIAKHSGADPERDIMEGASDAFILGSAIGGGFGAVNATAKQVASSRLKKEINNSVSKISELNYIINNTPDIPEDVKESLTKLRDKISENVKTSLTNIDSKFSKLSEEQKTEFIGLKRRLNDIGREYESTENETIKKALELEAKEVADKIKRYAVQEQTTSEVPVQPETAVGEEVAEGAPEAESEVVTQEEIKIDRPSIIVNSKAEVDTVVAAATESETGQTFNIDGTVYSDGGLVVPVVSENLKQEELTPERIADFVEKNKGKIGSNAVKVGIYKFPNKNEVSIDLNIVVPRNNREAALEFGKIAGQESLFDLDTFENIKTGSDGKSPRNFTDEEFRRISKELEEGRVPETGQQQTLAAEQGTPTTIEGTGLRENIKKSIAKVFNNFDTKSFKSAKEMAAYAKAKFNEETGATDSARIFVGSDGKVEILVNEEIADDTALGHEVWHALLLKAFGDNQAKFAEFRGAIDKTLRQNGYEDIADALDEFSSQYTEEGEVPAEEYLAQLGGLMTSANIDLKKLTPAQKSLLQQIKDIINDFAIQLTGQPVFLKEATPETILDFMSTMSDMMAKGEDISGLFEGGKKTSKTRAQKAAIEILDGPKFDNKLKEDVASYLNSLRDSELPPNSSREQLMERFINNVYEEVGYYLFSKPDARSAGLTWYIEDMVEFENKVKVILPELSNEKQYKLFLSILAFTSSGTNPNQNLSYAYNLWNNSNDPKNFEFSKDWGDKKLSFVDKKGKAVASGVIVKETAREYTVELVDSLGRPEVDSKGNKKYEKVSKASMKPGYPKSTGYTNRGKIIVGQLKKLEKLYADLKSIDAVVKWLETPHPIAELRKYNEAVPDVNGKGPGKTNKKYDPSKNADGERNGAFIFGEKIGSFYQNMIGIGETITMDLWWSRTWNRYMGTMINTTSGNKEIQEVPRSDRERNIMREAVKMVAEDLNLQVSELQAAIWYFEQELWTKSGNASPSYSYVTAIDELTEKLKVDEETRTKLRAAEADLTEAEKRRQNAAERAAAVVASKGGEIPKVEVRTRAQKTLPDNVAKRLTEDGNGNYVFHHYSRQQRDKILPSTGSGSLFTSREEQAALSSIGGMAMYYAQNGQKEAGVGNELHTIVIPKDKVYYMNEDVLDFFSQAKEEFLKYMNRGKPREKWTQFAFEPNYQVAFITKIANENGFEMVVNKWRNDVDFRAQTTLTLKPEKEDIPFKKSDSKIDVGDKVFVFGQEGLITEINDNGVARYTAKSSAGRINIKESQQFRPGEITLLEKGPFDFNQETGEFTTRAQKAQPTEATENDFVLPFGKYKGQWYSTTPKNYKEFLLKQDWFDPRKYFAKTLENANESFGTEDGEVKFKSRAQKIDKKKTKELSSSIINNFNDEELENAKSLINKVEPPKKTIKAYKLFKVKKEFPGELFPLFVGANESVTTGEWIEAKAGELTQTKEGKTMVKSTLGPLAYRPGWHSGDIAVATHIGSKKNASDKAPTLRADDQVWAEVEVGNDFDWQTEANNRASKTKDGKVVPRTAHITDQVPSKGFYKYKTNSNMTGSWIISGEMKVNRVLTEKEVEEINKKSNAKDLPRLTPFDYEAYGFDKNGSVKNTKQVIANQISRAYQIAKESGENAELVSFVERKAITRAQKAQPQNVPENTIKTRAQKRNTYTNEQYGDMSRNGVIFHAGSQSIATLDPSKIKGGFRATYGWGVYFAGTINKASDYGDMITFLDSKKLNFLKITENVTNELISDIEKIKEKNIYYGLFIDRLKGMLGLEINESRLRMGDYIRWDYYELWSKMFMEAGYDGFNQSDNEYIVFNMQNANKAILEDPLKAITRAQKAQPQTIPGYDRMIGEAKSIVEKSKKRGVSAAQIAENVINYIQKSRVYERADDLQREQIIRDARKDLGLRQKSAPRVDRVLGIKDSVSTEDKKNLMEVIKAQVKATKNLVKAQKEIAKQINKEIRELKEKGKITTSQMIAALRRLSEVDLLNEESVSNFLDYIARVFKDAAYYERVTNINRKRRAARNSASTKIGIADGLTPLLQKIFSIDARTIPEKALDAYEELVNMFADRSRVLQLSDIENVTKMAQKVFEAVEGDVERARSLAEVLSNYENMATDENGNIEFSKTVDQMVNDGSISAEDGELMKKYKSMILEEAGLKKEKDVRSEEEIEEERQQLVETVRNYTPVFFQLPTQDERDVAREIFRLIKTGAIDKMSNKDLKDLLRIIDNIERGFLPHSAQIMKERMNQINNGETLSEAVNNAKMLPVESRYAKIKALFGGSAIRKAIDRNPLFFIDELFGNFKSRPIFESIFRPISRAFSLYQSDVNTINRKIQNAMDELSNSLGKNPNKMQFAKQKIMAYMLESEYQANPNSKEVRSAKDFLDATIKYAEETEQNSYSDKDIKNLKKIRDEFFSGETIDLDAMLESFSSTEKKAIKTISDINNELSGKVAFTSAIIRGRKVGALNNYIHHNTLGERSAADIATEVSMADVFNASMKPSTKAKSLIERTGAATPLVFDPFSSTTRGARQLLMDYHLTEPIRTARRTVKYADGKVTGKQKRILNAISGGLEQALSNTLINTYHETTFVEDTIRYIEQTGYRAMLGSVPRAAAELTSNLSYVMIYDPESFIDGVSKYGSVAMSETGLNVMKNVRSQQIERLYPASKLSGRLLDREVMSQASGIKAGKSRNDVVNAMTIIYNYSGKQVKNVSESTADALISSPDKVVMKPLWFGAFASEFKKATGQDVDYDKIANNNEAYLTEFREAIDQASGYADETSIRVGSSDNPFTGILKGANVANQSVMKQAFNKFNNFMSHFLITEYSTARTGVYALMGNGKLTQKQGAAILGATMSRMIVYSLLSKELVSIMMGMLGFGDDEEDEKTFFQKLGQAIASSFSGLILGRNFGNFTKAPINIGVEKVNREFLDFLREGEYDPYEDAIQYTIIPKDERKQGDIMEYIKSFSGAFSPVISTAQRTLEVVVKEPKTQAAQERRLRELSTRTPLEILGNTGYIPLYRDVRKIVMEYLYKDMRKEKKGSGSGGIKTSIDTKIK
jgi:hypothetical protein